MNKNAVTLGAVHTHTHTHTIPLLTREEGLYYLMLRSLLISNVKEVIS